MGMSLRNPLKAVVSSRANPLAPPHTHTHAVHCPAGSSQVASTLPCVPEASYSLSIFVSSA